MKVGIDLGTTYSLIARISADGKAELLPDNAEQDVFHTPSVVHIGRSCAMVGRMADTLNEQNPDLRVIRFFKRLLGGIEPLFFDDQGSAWSPEALAALVLKKLRFDAESYASRDIEGTVISVPAHFNDVQRKAVLTAGFLADLAVIGLVEEPVAAAIHYGVTATSHDKVVLVYDFGGGTFDATILTMNSKLIQVLASTGLSDVGGKELDESIGEIVLDQFQRATGDLPELTSSALLTLRRICEDIKIMLCTPNRSFIRQSVLLMGRAAEVTIRRSEFERSIGELVGRTEAETLRCVKDAGLNCSDIDSVLLVGGSSQVPFVRQRVRALFSGNTTLNYHEPSKAVALGAALRASQISGDADRCNIPAEFRGVSGYFVGIRTLSLETGRATVDTLIRKNMPLPVSVRKVYFTTRADQDRMVLELVQYRDSDQDLINVGTLVVGPLPSPRSNYPIEVTVENREDGTINLRAYDSGTGVELAKAFKRDNGGAEGAVVQRALIRSTLINNL